MCQTKDPAVASLYEKISLYWQPKKKSRKSLREDEEEAEAEEGCEGEDDDGDMVADHDLYPELPRDYLADDDEVERDSIGERALARALLGEDEAKCSPDSCSSTPKATVASDSVEAVVEISDSPVDEAKIGRKCNRFLGREDDGSKAARLLLLK